MAEMGHGGDAVDFHLGGEADLILGEGQSRPENVSSFEDFHPVVVLDDGFDQSEIPPAMAGVDFDFLLGGRVFLPPIELRFCFI